ncbi:hypothetical protein JW707_01080, partial [Candidatus Woesearchaeota archaeon]|nr:hypothetical protein [Candidatus Woesearchaeota archaeon]
MSNKRGSVELAALLVAFTFIMMGVTGMYMSSSEFVPKITGLASGGEGESYSTLSESFQKEWEYSSSGTVVRGMVVDANNNTIVVGYTGSPYYIYVEKINSSGDYQWDYTSSFNIQQLDPIYDAVAVDSNGNIYLAGYGTHLIGVNSWQDAVIEKIDSTGSPDWADAFTSSYGSGEASNDFAGGVAVDSNDNVIVYATGWNHGSSIYYPIIRQYDSSGSLQWEHAEYNTNANIGYGAGAVAVDSSDNVIATLLASGWYVVKLNSSGDHLWNTTFNSYSEGVPYQIATDSSNNIIIVGDLSSSDWHI